MALVLWLLCLDLMGGPTTSQSRWSPGPATFHCHQLQYKYSLHFSIIYRVFYKFILRRITHFFSRTNSFLDPLCDVSARLLKKGYSLGSKSCASSTPNISGLKEVHHMLPLCGRVCSPCVDSSRN